jgi:ketosteroid isomerase-like protein
MAPRAAPLPRAGYTEFMSADPSAVASAFVAAINSQDLHALAALLHPEHRFVDAEGAVFAGREPMLHGWAAYFNWFPEYTIVVEHSLATEAHVALFGTATGSGVDNAFMQRSESWSVPAAWLAEVRDGQVYEWRVYCDVRPQLAALSGK